MLLMGYLAFVLLDESLDRESILGIGLIMQSVVITGLGLNIVLLIVSVAL